MIILRLLYLHRRVTVHIVDAQISSKLQDHGQNPSRSGIASPVSCSVASDANHIRIGTEVQQHVHHCQLSGIRGNEKWRLSEAIPRIHEETCKKRRKFHSRPK